MIKRTFQESAARLRLRIGDVGDLINVLGSQSEGVVLPLRKSERPSAEVDPNQIFIEGDASYAEAIVELGSEQKDVEAERNK